MVSTMDMNAKYIDHPYGQYMDIYMNVFIKPKGVHLLTMGRFNKGLVLNKFSMDMIKYGWNILSSHTKLMAMISIINFLATIKTSVYVFTF
jgi:hypothetical protein